MIGVNEGSSLFQAASHSCRSLSEETTTKNMEKKMIWYLGLAFFVFSPSIVVKDRRDKGDRWWRSESTESRTRS